MVGGVGSDPLPCFMGAQHGYDPKGVEVPCESNEPPRQRLRPRGPVEEREKLLAIKNTPRSELLRWVGGRYRF